MAKKTLLNESQVRQFMKLASLEPLTPGFVRGLTKESHGRGRNEGDAGYGHPDHNTRLEEDEDSPEALEDYAAGDLERDEPGEAVEDELEAGAEVGGEDVGGEQMISVKELLLALETAIEEVTGEEVSAELDPDLEGEEEIEAELVPGEEEMDVEAGPEVELQEGDDDEEELQEGGDKKGDEPADDLDYEKKNESTAATDDLVEQITKRVAARILKSALSKK